ELWTALGDVALDVSLDVEGGQCLALAGPSGAGKTSILRMIAGTQQPAAGRISYAEEVWLDRGRRLSIPPERRRCGYLPQDHGLFPHLSAWRNVAYGLRASSRL